MTEQGEIISIEGRTAFVRFKRTSACGKCKVCGFKEGQTEITVPVENTLDAPVGAFVSVSMPTSTLLKASAMAYIFPLLMLGGGIALGFALWPVVRLFESAEIFAALCGILMTVAAFFHPSPV